MKPSSRIGIIGAGTMGAGIALVAATSGFEVALIDTKDDLVARGMQRVMSGLQREVDKERMTGDDRDTALGRISTGTAVETLTASDLVIEAVVESFDAKAQVLRQVADVVDGAAILATNTSSISVTALAATVPYPERFAGMHFFNPVPVLKLVEVVRGLQTSDATAATIREVAERMGKTPVEVADMPGFAANRILIPMINEAIFAVADGVASAEEIDTVMTLGASHPMG
ncbi:MAG: 3-hydroxyacyl-CoA dehydrogenase NAD-binding domain-containing protein, partial [Chloroflexota bacterium]|nr:3-hydroxyacyl-CoA dehydrogenase NAD-binding domain-containing protein [Chloroflexota bacterium]